jgi:single-strand DNA-binding protein
MALPPINGEFRLGTDPDLRYTPGGMAVCEARAVASSRKKNEQTGEWHDDKSAWVTLTAFKELAENMAESLNRGDLVVVLGRLEIAEWTDKDDNKRTTPKVLLDNIGPSLVRATAQVSKKDSSSGGGGSRVQRTSGPVDNDPWATTPATSSDEPPF